MNEEKEPVQSEMLVTAEARAYASLGLLNRSNVDETAQEMLAGLRKTQKLGQPVTGEILDSPDPLDACAKKTFRRLKDSSGSSSWNIYEQI